MIFCGRWAVAAMAAAMAAVAASMLWRRRT
jgi:hypothetical protein